MSTNPKMTVLILTLIVAAAATTAVAIPPEHMNYQGVLRDAAGNPLDGSFDMVFRFYGAQTFGTLYWEEEHLDPASGGTGQVTVSGGLFNVALGTGFRSNGTAFSLSEVFAQGDVWLEVQVGTETLAPRTQVRGAGYALNSAQLDGRTSDQFLDTSSTDQAKYASVLLDSSSTSKYGIESYGPGGGGYFKDKDGTGEAKAGYGNYGIYATGTIAGGHFTDPDTNVWARLGYGNYGLYTTGSVRADGNLTLGGEATVYGLRVNNVDLYMNQTGPDATSSIYFHEDGHIHGARMFWNNTFNWFEFSHRMRVPGSVTATMLIDDDDSDYFLNPGSVNTSGVMAGNLTIGNGSNVDDDYLFFDAEVEYLKWENGETRFVFTDALALSGPLQAGGTGTSSVAYNRFGTGVPAWSDIQSDIDLFVTDDLEVGGDVGFSKIVLMEAQNTAGADGDQSIYFYDQDAWNANYLRWDDLSAVTCGTLGTISSGFNWNIADNADSGWVFANGSDNEAVIDELGNVEIDGSLYQSGSCDLAETFFGPEGLTPGTVVVLDPDRPEGVRASARPHDPMVVGVVTTRPGVLLSGPSADAYPVWRELERVGRLLAATPPVTGDAGDGAAESSPAALDSYADGPRGRRLALEQRAGELEAQLDQWARGNVAVALVGRVPVKVDASYGAVRKGSYLTTSATPGHARALDGAGPYLGIAMEELASGTGEVLVLLSKGWYGGAKEPVERFAEEPRETPAVPASPPVPAGLRETESGLAIVLDGGEDEHSRFSIHRTGDAGVSSEVFRVDGRGNVFATGSFRPAAMDLAEFFPVSEPVSPGDVVVVDREIPGHMALGRLAGDPAVVGIVSTEPGVLLGSGLQGMLATDPDLATALDDARVLGDETEEARLWDEAERRFSRSHAAVALTGTAPCKVDAGYGSIRAGDLLIVSPTPGHAMRAPDPTPQGTVLGKALEPLEAGTGTIRVLVMMR